jgi:hypothetical protein
MFPLMFLLQQCTWCTQPEGLSLQVPLLCSHSQLKCSSTNCLPSPDCTVCCGKCRSRRGRHACT